MRSITVPIGAAGALGGDLVVPSDPLGLVVFAHGSGSSRSSPRNRFVAERLRGARLATLLIDLLIAQEDMFDRRSGQYRFDIDLLARRLQQIVDWTGLQNELADLYLGLFGASTGAAAALVVAAHRADRVGAVVSRGGRPDLARDALSLVTSPTLLIVGSRDRQVLQLNRVAAESLAGECRLDVVDGATHLFEEPGALERVADLAVDWFIGHVRTSSDDRS